MASTNVGDAVALTFEAVASISVTAELITPAGLVTAPVPVPADTTNPAHYTWTFIPDRTGVWRVRFRGSGAAVATEVYDITVTDTATGPAPYATSATITSLWRELTAEETDRADVLCRFASQIIRSKLPHLDTKITAGTIPGDLATLVCATMVLRVLKNPSGLVSEAVGPWSVTYGSSGTEATGRLTLTDEDIAVLTGTPAGEHRGTVRLIHSANPFDARRRARAYGAEI